MPRRPLPAVVAVLATLIALLATGSASASASDSARFVADANAARGSAGLPPYARAGDLDALAQRRAEQMAANRAISHDPTLGSDVCCWQSVGENVGYGPDEPSVQRAFMNSPEHRDNIMATDYTQIGVGTARGSDGYLYVDEIFRQPQGAPPPSSAPPPPPASAQRGTAAAPQAATAAALPREAPLRASRSAAREPLAATLPSVLTRRLHAAAGVAGGGDPLARAEGFQRVMRTLAGR